MPGKNLLLTTIHGQTASRAVIAGGGKVTAIADAQYLLQMSDERTARDNIIVKRAGDDLQIFIDGIDEPNLTLENFYGDETHAQLCNVDADGQIHAYLRTDGLGSDGHLLLADGESAPLFLGGPALGVMPEAIGATTDHAAAIPLWPYLAGAAAIGAAGTGMLLPAGRAPPRQRYRPSGVPTDGAPAGRPKQAAPWCSTKAARNGPKWRLMQEATGNSPDQIPSDRAPTASPLK